MAINYTVGEAFGYGTVSSTVLTLGSFSFTTLQIGAASRMVATVNSNAVCYRYDNTGGTVTTTAGMLGTVGEVIVLLGKTNISNFQVIRSGSSDATLAITLETAP